MCKYLKILERMKDLQGSRSVAAFARFLEIPQKTLDSCIKGERKPSVEILMSLCAKCNVSADWLLGLSDDRGGPRGAGSKFEPSKTSSSRIVDSRLSDAPLLAEIAALKRRVDALESQPSFACS